VLEVWFRSLWGFFFFFFFFFLLLEITSSALVDAVVIGVVFFCVGLVVFVFADAAASACL